jgi:biopolymer transport protein ExbD
MSRRTLHSKHSHDIEEPSVNLTPLIDVVFVILIMFIVVAPLLEIDRIELADAGSSSVKEAVAVQEASPIAVHVRKDNTVLFNNQKVTLDQLPALLARAKQRHPKAKPQLFHDKQAWFGTYQAVKNAVEEAGYQEMDVILKPS